MKSSVSNKSLDIASCKEIVKNLKLIVFDFDGVFTDNSVYVLDNGQEMVRCSRFDGFGIRILEALELDSFILSKEKNPVVTHRANKLKIKCHQGIDEKREFLNSYLKEKKLTWENVCYVGNDINDIECLELAGLAIAVQDSFPTVFSYTHLTTEINGGHGAVREVCEFLKEQRG